MAWHSYHHAWIEEKQSQKKNSQAQDSTSCSHEKSCKTICPGCKVHSQAQRLSKKDSRGMNHHLHRNRVGDVPRRLAHEAKAGEVACLALGPLIILGAGGVIAGEVEVAEGDTRSGHHLLKLLLLLVPEAVLLLALALVAGVIPVVVVVFVGGVDLLPLGAVGDEVSGVATLETAPRRPPPLIVESVQRAELPRQQGDLIVRDALVLLIRSCTQGRQDKLQSR
jgi:hypothetical protein